LIEDNGSGFSTEAKTGGDGLQSGGTGMQSMQERLELIRCYLPATLSIESIKEKGSTVCLEISRS
jgi:signal transduction histidine kinase